MTAALKLEHLLVWGMQPSRHNPMEGPGPLQCVEQKSLDGEESRTEKNHSVFRWQTSEE